MRENSPLPVEQVHLDDGIDEHDVPCQFLQRGFVDLSVRQQGHVLGGVQGDIPIDALGGLQRIELAGLRGNSDQRAADHDKQQTRGDGQTDIKTAPEH